VAGSLRHIQIHDDDWLRFELRRRPRDDCEIRRSNIGGCKPPGVSASEGQNMRAVQLNDVGHENALARGELLAASAIAQFYTFASRCMDWANTTRSLQERALYIQMGLQWLDAGARLHTLAQLKNSAASQCDPSKETRVEMVPG